MRNIVYDYSKSAKYTKGILPSTANKRRWIEKNIIQGNGHVLVPKNNRIQIAAIKWKNWKTSLKSTTNELINTVFVITIIVKLFCTKIKESDTHYPCPNGGKGSSQFSPRRTALVNLAKHKSIKSSSSVIHKLIKSSSSVVHKLTQVN